MSEAIPSEQAHDSTNDLHQHEAPARVASVDILRGLTILTMVFVNDVGPAAPSWAHHIQPPDADGMTVADVVFPTFLFLVGVSIPLAFQQAQRRGHSLARQLVHVASRTLGLILMGLVQYNYAADQSMGQYWWGLLAYISIIFAWCIVPTSPGIRRNTFLCIKSLGCLGIFLLFVFFRREATTANIAFYGEYESWRWLQTGWWGILGLIGWAYLVGSLIYICVGRRREWLMGAMALLYLLFIADRSSGLFSHLDSKNWVSGFQPLLGALQSLVEGVDQFVDLGGILGSQAAITVAGCMLGSILIAKGGIEQPSERFKWALLFALGLFLAGCVADFFAGINKIGATPTWCLWSSAIAAFVWAIGYAVWDIWKFQKWSFLIQPAGANPLIAYLLHPILLWTLSLTGLSTLLLSYKNSDSATTAMLGSFVMAMLVCSLTGLIAKIGLRVRI